MKRSTLTLIFLLVALPSYAGPVHFAAKGVFKGVRPVVQAAAAAVKKVAEEVAKDAAIVAVDAAKLAAWVAKKA